MTSNLHSVGLMQFLTEASQCEQQITRSTLTDVDKVIKFINDNQELMCFLAEHPSEIREPVKKLSERLRQIESTVKEAANTIDQYLNAVSLVHDARKADLPQTGKDMCDLEMKNALASASQIAKSMQQPYAEVTIEEINENHPRFEDLGFEDAEEAITFLINSPEKDRLKYVNFEGLPLNNEQFEKLTKNCPNLLHIEIPGSLLTGDSFKHIANLTELQSLNISGCYKLKSDALKHIANLTNLQSLFIRYCTQLERNALKYIENLVKLKSLFISGCSQLAKNTLKYLENLEILYLDIVDCNQFEIDDLKLLANLKRLQSLEIGCKRPVLGMYGYITGEKLEMLLNKLRNEL